MTQEEKAKAYDEALEKAKKALKTDIHESGMWAIQRIFPQLCESEDERIRKGLIEYFEGFRMGNAEVKWEGLNVQAVLVWLEKQKECVSNNFDDVWDEEDCEEIIAEGQKLTPRFKELLKEVCHAWYDRGAKLEKQKEQKHPNGCFTCDEYKKGYEEGRRNGFTAGYNKAMKEVEQKEQKPVVTHGETYHVDTLGTQQVIAGKMPQKPAEWSEKYIADVFEKVGLAKIVREQGNDGLTNALQAAMIELSKVRTTEWSEEDKDMLGKVLECIRFAEDHYQLEQEETNGVAVKWWLLDHIIPQPKVEWSEEDEKDMAHIIRILDDCYVYGTHDLSKTDYENLVNKLKSLRPQYHGDVTMTEAFKMGLEAGKASS